MVIFKLLLFNEYIVMILIAEGNRNGQKKSNGV